MRCHRGVGVLVPEHSACGSDIRAHGCHCGAKKAGLCGSTAAQIISGSTLASGQGGAALKMQPRVFVSAAIAQQAGGLVGI